MRRHGRRAPCDEKQEEEDLRSVLESSPKRLIKKNRELVIYRLGIIARKMRRTALRDSFRRITGQPSNPETLSNGHCISVFRIEKEAGTTGI